MSILVSLGEPILGEQPSRTPYEVLGIPSHEHDPRAIEEAALRCSSQARAYQLTRELESALRLNEIAQALITLLAPVCRREYDRELSKLSSPAETERRPAARRDAPLSPRVKSATPAVEGDVFALDLSDRRSCDVELVYRRRTRRGTGMSTSATGSFVRE
jgi:hypothetical protein